MKMNTPANRLLQYSSIVIASIATLMTSLIGAMYVSVFLKINSNVSAVVYILCVLSFTCGLTIVFKQISSLPRFIIGLILLAAAFLSIPTHNCGPEC